TYRAVRGRGPPWRDRSGDRADAACPIFLGRFGRRGPLLWTPVHGHATRLATSNRALAKAIGSIRRRWRQMAAGKAGPEAATQSWASAVTGTAAARAAHDLT